MLAVSDHPMQIQTTIDLNELAKTKLPPMPESVVRISALLQDVNVTQRALADAIGCDPMLSLRILKMANSPIYSSARSIACINDAVRLVGNRTIYEIVLVCGTKDAFAKEIRHSHIGRDNWHHSVATALLAREISIMLNLRGIEEAFTCGLLHDIGSILFLRVDKTLYEHIYNIYPLAERIQAEKEAFGVDHAELGAMIANEWKLPDPVCQTILHHHDPFKAKQGLLITNVINVADELAHCKLDEKDIDGELQFSTSASALKLTVEQFDELWEKVVPQMAEFLEALSD